MHHDPKTCSDCKQRSEYKATFAPGPWHDEPDRVDFEHAGLPCFLNRNSAGVWCGYVGVPNGHPYYEKDYDDVEADVHGGLTYADRCSHCLCHIPKPGESDDVWWLGFDCSHAHDLRPEALGTTLVPSRPRYYRGDETYRDLAYAKAQTIYLADQLAAQGKK